MAHRLSSLAVKLNETAFCCMPEPTGVPRREPEARPHEVAVTRARAPHPNTKST
jgi:hypothetical protein